ncbi:hypothetical protein B620_gp45 [Croceibacter phage P2559S]|uniref:hypothetical protein n=1 Tax=Croceibacter phage P2559S TaxID=1176422 RepID=UPI0002688EC8|nr:hypothetical protein B620_gp45 [Croceibacter phage P2559S]AFM54823.1 hypothetical protein P2559S_45 [Croceibacter phage P2559S]
MDIKLIDELLDMEMHASKDICTGLRAIRVLGGWLYETYCDEQVSIAFVPEPQHLLSREKPCKIYGHRFVQVTGASVKRLHGINLDDPNTHFICDKCGELTKSV